MTRRPWIPLSGAALVLVGVAGCGSDGPSVSSLAGSTGGATPGTVAAATVPAAGSDPVATTGAGSGDASSETGVTAAPPTVPDPSATAGSAAATSDAATVPAWAAGFGRATVTMAGRPLQVVVASTETQRHEGLRQVTSLAPFDGMLFVFDQDTRVAFTMSDTLIPLSIGFYDSTGQPVGQLEMTPCVGTDTTCPTYDIGRPIRYALETEAGHLPQGPVQI